MSQLPIDEILDDLILGLSSHPQIVLMAPPGAGKSTRIPQILLERRVFSGKIILLEPRRLAARNIARFLAFQYGEPVGQTVGLRVRGESRVSEKTRIEIVTEGVLTRMIQSDPELKGVDLVIFDEFHERSLHADLALALTLDVQGALREDLRLIIMSATLDERALSGLLPMAKILTSQGRCFPVEVRYHPISRFAHPSEALASVIVALLESDHGSVLVFLPGVREIKQLSRLLFERISKDVVLCPLYGQLTVKAQQDAIAPAPQGMRKIVLATNIAETSLTIEGIRLVVDSGLERVARFNRKSGISKLETVQISRSSAIQRTGRAGRLSDGVCLRLYSEESFQRMRSTQEAEICTSDLMQLVFEVIQWGCAKSDLQWLDNPPTKHWDQGIDLLKRLCIVDEDALLTVKGKYVGTLGIDARLGAMMHSAELLGKDVFSLACWLAAWAEDPPRTQELDLRLQLITLYENKKSGKGTHYQRAKSFAAKRNFVLSDLLDCTYLGFLAAMAWPDRIAKSRGRDGRFLLSNGHGAQVDINHPFSLYESLVAIDLVSLSQGDSRIFTACELDLDDMYRQLPALFSPRDWIDWDDKKGGLIAMRQICLGEIVFHQSPLLQIDEKIRTQALLQAIRRNGLACLSMCEKSSSLLLRCECAKAWSLPLSLPKMDEKSLLDELEEWFAPFMVGCSDLSSLRKVDVYRALQTRVGWDCVKALDFELPLTYQVASGKHFKIRYQRNQKPVLSVKMQEMYGQTSLPSIAQGKVILVLELLSPASRPLQVTQDLAGFWKGTYKDVQKEMKGRYPKHVWPDDPAHYLPVVRTKKPR